MVFLVAFSVGVLAMFWWCLGGVLCSFWVVFGGVFMKF